MVNFLNISLKLLKNFIIINIIKIREIIITKERKMSEMQRERDLVLNPNEYAYVLDKTKGLISCVVGSYKMSLSTSDSLVIFNQKTKRFEEASFTEAITTFVSAPENWYITLKNPAKEDKHPTPGTANSLPELQIGKKVNIRGNVSFALYPGQMAKAIQGHRLHLNQYLLARVYDAEALYKNEKQEIEFEEQIKLKQAGLKEQIESEEIIGSEQQIKSQKNKYTIGQLLVIKGTEVPFYIPPTGIEVLAVDQKKEQYIREAVTLERLEYCILKDEQGNKKYIHGAAVVFPEPDETFVPNPKGGYKFRAIELSEISGVYVKVIADYKEKGREYKTGEELFITGTDQMIYYPKPEHAIISYEGKVIHHAVAIPLGEGRYVLDRKTGNIKTVKGAVMYLPDPRNEVIVKRKLTKKECELWYPGNDEVLTYNGHEMNSRAQAGNVLNQTEIDCLSFCLSADSEELDNGFLGQENAVVEDAGFSRENTYSKPRTITLDNKYEGVVTIDVWTGYAICVISKNGERKIITGAQTYLMEYDETLEILELSTVNLRTRDKITTVFLKTRNNKINDLIIAQTKDFVKVKMDISYSINFLPEYKEKWFDIKNYVKYLCDRQRVILKNAIETYTIEEFYENVSDIVRNIILNGTGCSTQIQELEKEQQRQNCFFEENGMLIYDVEVLNINIEQEIADILEKHQQKIVEKSLEFSNVSKEMEFITKLAEVEKRKSEIEYASKLYRLELENKFLQDKLEREEHLNRLEEKAKLAAKNAEQEIQAFLDSIQKSELTREQERRETEIAYQKEQNNLAIEKQAAYTEAIQKVIQSISPDLIASMTSVSNAELLKTVTEAMSPYAIAAGESVSEVVNKLLRGTSLERILGQVGEKE